MRDQVSKIEIVKSATMGWVIVVERVGVGMRGDTPYLAGVTSSVTYTVGNAEDVSALVKGVLD